MIKRGHTARKDASKQRGFATFDQSVRMKNQSRSKWPIILLLCAEGGPGSAWQFDCIGEGQGHATKTFFDKECPG